MERIWYLAYGSNLATARFRCYLAGGRPDGGARHYAGCRDPSDPTRSQGVEVPGGLVFAGRSRVWGGGMAFYDRTAASVVAGRAHLVTTEQLADVVAQESDLYSSVVTLGELDGVPMCTFTHPDLASLAPAAPTAAYLHWICVGLREAHGYDDGRIARYLAAAPGVCGAWTEPEIVAVATAGRAVDRIRG